MNGTAEYCDLHCHLMPYVDDGAYDREECLELLQMEYQQGVRRICLTPHLRADMFETSDEEVCSHFVLVQELAREAELPLELSYSREYHVDRLFWAKLEAGDLLPLGKGRTLLVEFGGRHSGEDMLDALKRVRDAGYAPLIAHAERYAPLQGDWAFARELKDASALLQLNAGSILGREGLRQRHLCRQLLAKGLADVIASDAHDACVRVPELRACAEQIEKRYGIALARRLLETAPRAILEG